MQLLLLLLVLSLASLHEAVNNHSAEENVLPLTPDLKLQVSDVVTNVTISAVHLILRSSETGHKMQADPYASVLDPNSKLRWEKWNDTLQMGAVYINNEYTERIDYVCKYQCFSGFYSPSKGPNCYYPYQDKELAASSFEILVNEDDFEKLEWKEGSYGSVPEHAVINCFTNPMYVGKNQYGLGTVYPKDKCFYLPWEGTGIWYQRSYEVLTTNMDIINEALSDVKYNTDLATIIKSPPQILKTLTISNADCQPVTETASITIKTSETSTWDFSFSQMIGEKVSFTTGIPFIESGMIEFSSETTFEYSKGKSVTEETTYTVSLSHTVQPMHSCVINIVGFKYETKIPCTTRLTRTYKPGETRSTIISAIYNGVQSTDIIIKVDHCEPLPDTKSCV